MPAVTDDQHILLCLSQAGIAVDSALTDCSEVQRHYAKNRHKSCVEFSTDDHEDLKPYIWMYSIYCDILDVLSLTLVWIAVALSHVDY